MSPATKEGNIRLKNNPENVEEKTSLAEAFTPRE
jgi:hypothetical protein